MDDPTLPSLKVDPFFTIATPVFGKCYVFCYFQKGVARESKKAFWGSWESMMGAIQAMGTLILSVGIVGQLFIVCVKAPAS